MKVSRRALIKGGAVGAALATPVVRAAGQSRPSLLVYDSRAPKSLAFARAASVPVIDVAREDARFWRSLRASQPAGRIVGLTSWSDLVIIRGLLEEQGKRLVFETVVDKLFRWEMA
jgi:hypothetical protein